MVGPHQILTLGWTQGWKIFGVHTPLRSPGELGAFLLFPMEMKSPKFESSELPHPSSPGAAKPGCGAEG